MSYLRYKMYLFVISVIYLDDAAMSDQMKGYNMYKI